MLLYKHNANINANIILGCIFFSHNTTNDHDNNNIWITSRIITAASSMLRSINRTEMHYYTAWQGSFI